MTCRRITLAAALTLTTACAQAPATPVASTPTLAPADPFDAQPAHAELRVDAAPDAQALLLAAAMSHLGKTTAEFDGHAMVIIEHDPEELLDEAFADPSFCELVAAADIEPRDGLLSAAEAGRLEATVLARLD